MNLYLSSVHRIFTGGRFTNSYKFALARAIVKLAPQLGKGKLFISKDALAQCFLEYYWPLETAYHLRQGIDPDKDPVVMVQIRALVKKGVVEVGETLGAFKKRSGQEFENLLRLVRRTAFGDVLRRFHTVRQASVRPKFFELSGGNRQSDGVMLTSYSKAALVDYGKIIDYMAVAAWVDFTEGFTAAPKLFQKLSGEQPKRKAVTKWLPELSRLQDCRCFYCREQVQDQGDIDHLMPWSFVLEDKTWNLVLACRPCNSTKRDRVVSPEALQRLLDRNEAILKGALKVSPRFVRHFVEWKERDLSGHIRTLHAQAHQDGFPVWMD